MDAKLLFEYNLQYFAKEGPGGEKTEPATDKKKDDARKEGQVAKSKELNGAISLFAMFLVLRIYIGNMGISFLEVFSESYNRIPEMTTLADGFIIPKEFAGVMNRIIIKILLMLLPFLAVAFLVAFIVDLVQVKWKPTAKPMQPKFSKLDPTKGIKRLFSLDKLMDLLKSLIKLFIIGYVAYSTLKDQAGQLFLLYDMQLVQALALFGDIVINMALKICAVYLIVGILDYAYQKHKFNEDLKMTKQEVKDEFKNAEGDPQIKGKQRQRMQEASRRRMMQEIPQADVVITNPTHFAVALRYDPEKAPAPYVIAKGEDFLAARIKEEAIKNNVDVVENKPLARMLYYNVDLGAQIPQELYSTVAEILAVIYNKREAQATA
ncbi:MAG TPA: flagellar biosynthesis protein FlhB [Lachnospiraceae bacterium]|nr:flagellar biosynthesis protein FlhB [Lachnospiraceae bacterium]